MRNKLHVYIYIYMYTRVSEKLSSRQKKKKKGDTWVYNISVNLNSTCICTIVQGDVKEISFFFLYQRSEDTFIDGILVYRVWGVCAHVYTGTS